MNWDKAHLYCANDANCRFNTRVLDLTTPINEPNNSYLLSRETTREIFNILSSFVGERGDNESASETLTRIINERNKLLRREIERLFNR